MNKNEALKMAIEALEDAQKCLMGHLFLEKLPYVEAINACEEALEQPTQEPVATIQQFERKWIDKEALKQPEEPRLVSYALDCSTCTLNIDGEEVYFNREQPAQEPVAWLYKREKYSGDWYVVTNYEKENDSGSQNIEAYDIPLYTHPHQWQGLTDDEIVKELERTDEYVGKSFFAGVRWAEQALRSKNE